MARAASRPGHRGEARSRQFVTLRGSAVACGAWRWGWALFNSTIEFKRAHPPAGPGRCAGARAVRRAPAPRVCAGSLPSMPWPRGPAQRARELATGGGSPRFAVCRRRWWWTGHRRKRSRGRFVANRWSAVAVAPAPWGWALFLSLCESWRAHPPAGPGKCGSARAIRHGTAPPPRSTTRATRPPRPLAHLSEPQLRQSAPTPPPPPTRPPPPTAHATNVTTPRRLSPLDAPAAQRRKRRRSRGGASASGASASGASASGASAS
ncbi:MAG: hypothetical protein QOJ82_3724, partial [Solirubrobacteraceae bacterium]|nr:hypothetical protein [Solirubrobacteraceae bacterium]